MTDGPLAIITDLHLEPNHADEILSTLDDILANILTEDPSRIVVLGDIVQETNEQTDREMLQRCVARLDSTSVPYQCLPGNHDVEHLSGDRFSAIVGNELWEIDESHGHVFLDSSAPQLSGSRGEISEEQLQALQRAISTLEEIVVFTHHPVHYQDLRENYWFNEHPEEAFCGNKRAVRELLEPVADRITAVVTGHLHEWNYAERDTIPHFVVDAFNKRLNPAGETGGYALLRTDGETQFEHHAGDETVHQIRLPE